MNLVLPKSIKFKLDDYEIEHIETMSREMYDCPTRRGGRSYQQVYDATLSGVILEYALVRQGAVKNNSQFDVKDRNTYNWDVLWHGLKTEVKCTADPSKMPKERKTKWVTTTLNNIQTFLNNIAYDPDCVDIVIFGCYNKLANDVYECKWRLIAPADTFKSNLRKCNPAYSSSYDKKTKLLKYFYSHFSESRAIYNSNL
jgi:hypothetical protein